ncbi:hypothetical protein OS493_037446 [Desmophyllum pertusum]|uniref:Uncharacterized protein n=1 Tax=Desmophyllum pertusum TaxID=174260 RepID=A0A9W9YAB8_9CNID|nr:hypothetical protein OS493_037446 [Desmophyllum pertusum]
MELGDENKDELLKDDEDGDTMPDHHPELPRKSENKSEPREVQNRKRRHSQTSLPAEERIKSAEKAIQSLKRHSDKGTCPSSFRYTARANIKADDDFIKDIKHIRKKTEQEFVKALTRYHYRDIDRSRKEIKQGKRLKGVNQTQAEAEGKINQVLCSVNRETRQSEPNSTTFQGTGQFIPQHGSVLSQESSSAPTQCNKDTGGRKTLQRWSRGVFLVVSGGGHIEYWQPLLGGNQLIDQSESPTQAFLVLILWLYRKFKPLLEKGLTPEQITEKMSSTIVAYDNMCHVDGMKLAKCDLPFQEPFDKMWQNVVKVIDRLHIRNHTDKKCQTVYNPEGKIPARYNTMAAEQTNVWASKLKRIICVM